MVISEAQLMSDYESMLLCSVHLSLRKDSPVDALCVLKRGTRTCCTNLDNKEFIRNLHY